MRLRAWQLVHVTAYLCWPVAVLHGLGTGSDTQARWVLALTIACVAVVACLTLWRVARIWPARPLAPGRAQKAGTPPASRTHTPAADEARR